MSLAAAEALVKEVELLPTYLPSVALLQEALRKARDWLTKLAGLHRLDYSPYLEALELLLQRARPIQIQLEPLENLEKQVRPSLLQTAPLLFSWPSFTGCLSIGNHRRGFVVFLVDGFHLE